MERVTIEEVCPSIGSTFYVRKLRDTRLNELLIVAVNGIYRRGSAGRADAAYIKGIVELATGLLNPHMIVVDLSDLTYEWGENMDLEFRLSDLPVAVVVGPKNRKALSTLANGIDSVKDIVDNVHFFADVPSAVRHVEKLDRAEQ